MSTRSGKRIHASDESPTGEKVDTDVILQRERKMRSKKQKENVEVTVKKKHNYVSYPADEDAVSVSVDVADPHEKLRKKRNNRRTTLKEYNVRVPVSDDLEDNGDTKSIRKSRRGKTLLIEPETNGNVAYIQKDSKSELDVISKKKNKKKKNNKKESVESSPIEGTEKVVIKKKAIKKKKGLKAVNNAQEVDVGAGDISDSFHSAASSPVNSKIIDKDNTQEMETEDNLTAFDIKKVANIADHSKSKVNASINKSRKSSIKNSTFEKSDEVCLSQNLDMSLNVKTAPGVSVELPIIKKRKSSIKDSTFDITEAEKLNESKLNTTFDKKTDVLPVLDMSADISYRKRKRSKINNSTTDINITNNLSGRNHNTTGDKMDDVSTVLNTTVDISSGKRRKSSIKNSTFDIDTKVTNVDNYFSVFDHTNSLNNRANGSLTGNKSMPKTSVTSMVRDTEQLRGSRNNDKVLNAVPRRTSIKRRKSDVVNSTYDNIPDSDDIAANKDPNSTYDRDTVNNGSSAKKSLQSNTIANESELIRSTAVTHCEGSDRTRKLDSTFNKDDGDLNTTYDTKRNSETLIDRKKSSPITSAASIDVTFDNSEENSRISITSDESKTENIMNRTPVLIESSIDSSMSGGKTPEESKPPVTPLQREGTFTKEASVAAASPKSKESIEKTPVKRRSSPGRTPFPFSKSSQKENAKLNVTRSIEKSLQRSSFVEAAPRQTRVMFCSPVNSQAVVAQVKGRVVKSNLKGSNKSFVIEDTVSSESRSGRRKRSFTVGAAGAAGGAGGEAATRAKRSRLGDELQHSVERLSRPRTQSAAGALPAGSPARRTRLPDFAALHRREFARMESLDECQRRRARRARALLTPTGSHALLQRISPKGTPPKPAPAVPPAKESSAKPRTPSRPRLPTLESLIPRYTRFGFKLNVDENPFEAARTEPRRRPGGPLPSLAGAAGLAGLAGARRAAARQAVMREKSFSERRDATRGEARTVIRGVRTNRRFELQMKMRNVHAAV